MKRILKYPIYAPVVTMPKTAEVVHVEFSEHTPVPIVWAWVTVGHEEDTQPWEFQIIPTGFQAVADEVTHLKTAVFADSTVWHFVRIPR